MPRIRFEVRSWERPPGLITDDQVGQHLVDRVKTAIGGGAAPLVGVVVRASRIDLVELAAPAREGLTVPLTLAVLARSEDPSGAIPQAVGVLGRYELRPRPDQPARAPLAMVFLEWEDCRWWHWRALVDGRDLAGDTESLRRAVDGDPLPSGLGRWWSLSRRRSLVARLEPAPAAAVVH